MKDYEQFYRDGGFRYDPHTQKRWLFNNTSLAVHEKGTTLLDAACGDGFWSFLLATHFDITGVDISTAGIEMANEKRTKEEISNIKFIVGDALKVEDKFDIVFCRAPSFFNMPSSDERFMKNLKKIFSLCNREIYYIVATCTPYERWAPSNFFDETSDGEWFNSKWYYHDPTAIEKAFNEFGKAVVYQKNGYILARLLREDLAK